MDFKDLFDRRILSLAGSTVTAGSLFVGGGIVLVTILIANVAAFWTRRLLRAREAGQGVEFAVSKIVRYTVTAIGLVAAVNTMGFRLDALLAASAVVAVGIGFGLQNIAQNFISGVILLIEQPVRHGDFVKVGDALGTVEDIGLRATHIITRDEVTIIVPNSALIGDKVVNHSRPTHNLRIRVGVGVAYGTDSAKVVRALLEVAGENPQVLSDPPPEVRLEDFADSALSFALLCWIAHPRDDLRVGSALRFSIDRVFRREGIEIPLPQRELHLHG
ncbi:MAG TPA: mechanosensitive ion channel domain-containing protein [Polyangiaceae bacterium]|nr:mechanosensitive ion channel domain-containing protein [Polyangiaceae bacterium]